MNYIKKFFVILIATIVISLSFANGKCLFADDSDSSPLYQDDYDVSCSEDDSFLFAEDDFVDELFQALDELHPFPRDH